MSTPAASRPIPLIVDAPQRTFDEARELLQHAGYTESAICQLMGLTRINGFELDATLRKPRVLPAAPSPLDVLARLFLEDEAVAAQYVSHRGWDLLFDLGLLARHGENGLLVSSTVMLYPVGSIYTVADRQLPYDGDPKPIDDIVYPAIVPNTGLFLDLAAPAACDAFLDLCAGTGIAALLAARAGAKHTWSCDVAKRSTVFAEFNRRLNGLDNVTAAEGDLYEPVRGLMFDRIVAHPPYVPVFRHQFIFDSGGQDGEQVVRRIIEGLPEHLCEGGTFHSLLMGSDRDQPYEQRVRGWLGAAHAQFDISFVVRRTLDPQAFAADNIVRAKGSTSDIAEWRKFFKDLGVTSMAYGFLTIRRHGGHRAPFTERRQTGKRSGPEEHRWLMGWESSLADRGASPLLDARPRANPEIDMRVHHVFQNNQWVPKSYLLETDHPFSMQLDAQPWMAYAISVADGTYSGREIFERLKREQVLSADSSADDFAETLALLVSGGFLRVDQS